MTILLPGQDVNVDDQVRQKIQFIEDSFYQQSDSLKQIYKTKLGRLDSAERVLKLNVARLAKFQDPLKTNPETGSIQHTVKSKIDGIQITRKLGRSLDSLNQIRDSTLLQMNQKIQTMKDKTVGKLKELNLPPEFSEKVSSMTSKITGFQIPATELNITSIKTPGIANIGKLDNLQMTTALQERIPGQIDELKNINGQVGGLTDAAGTIGEYGKDVQQFNHESLSKLQELPNAAEGEAQELSGLDGIKD